MIDVMLHGMTPVQMVYVTYFNELTTTVKRSGNGRFCTRVSTAEPPQIFFR
jgi:hypothetical protein